MHASIDAAARRNTNLTRAAMLSLGNSFSECRRVLRRIGSGTARLRPGARTGRPNVVRAGAWTDTGWPATMEGAVRSGLTAARLCRGHLQKGNVR